MQHLIEKNVFIYMKDFIKNTHLMKFLCSYIIEEGCI